MSEASASVSQQELKSFGLKATTPRMRILELFLKASGSSVRHLTAEDVYKKLLAENLDVGLATVYRVLTQFETAGLLVRRHLGTDLATYELDNGEHHDHIVCVRCGKIEEFVGKIEEFVDSEIENRQKAIAEKLGFELQGHSLSLYGLCAGCRKKAKNEKTQETKRR